MTPGDERFALVRLDGWAGRSDHRVSIVGETPTRYRVRWETVRCRRPRNNGWFETGSVYLVPKRAVNDDPKAVEANARLAAAVIRR